MKERSTKQNSEKKRNTAVVIALLLVCVLAIGGTIAYLTSHSQLTNTFTVGEIKPIQPEPDPGPYPDPGPEVRPENPEEDKQNGKLDGNLYEPHWDTNNAKLFPTATIPKDPYVGVGAGSEKCEVFVYVTNEMNNNKHIYFTINEGWEAVTGTTYVASGQEGQDGAHYMSGLFRYTKGLDGVKAKETGYNNAWTDKALFDHIVVSEEADAQDFELKQPVTGTKKTITVQSYLHQSLDSKGTQISETTIVNAAKENFGLN